MLKIGDFVDVLALDDPPHVPVRPERWLIVQVHPLRERRVWDQLTSRGVCCYLPRFPRRVQVGRRFAWQKPFMPQRMVPLFPGLVFVPDFDAYLPRLRSMADGVVRFLAVADRIASLSAERITDIRAIETRLMTPRSRRDQRLAGQYAVGDIVRIREGNPFALWTGRIERLDDRGRLRVLIDAVKREVAVDLSGHLVEPAT